MNKPIIALPLGDPGGIGIEIVLKSLRKIKKTGIPNQLILIGCLNLVEFLNKKLKTNLVFRSISLDQISRKQILSHKGIAFLDLPQQDHFLEKIQELPRGYFKGGAFHFSIGKVSPLNGLLSLESVLWALFLCQSRVADGITTAPVHKSAVRLVHKDFTGHTELLAQYADVKKVAMMFVSKQFKVTLVTIHLPLKLVSQSISQSSIIEKLELTKEALRQWFKIRHPKIAVSCLNPHGSEFGTEEKKIIEPAIKKYKKKYPYVYGPIPGDEIFRQMQAGKWDGIISMYHDQALAPFKAIAFHEGVNLTLGLPFIRTSPDHGTAFDIAYQNKADHRPMLEALKLAIKLAQKK